MSHDDDAAPALPPPRRGLAILLPDHHVRLEAICTELLSAAAADDGREVTITWRELEEELLDHMAAEEEIILPGYGEHAPDDARRIRDEHVRLRALLTPLGVEVELHEVRATRLRQLAHLLHAHAAHEDAEMYPWAEAHLGAAAHHALWVRISRWFIGVAA